MAAAIGFRSGVRSFLGEGPVNYSSRIRFRRRIGSPIWGCDLGGGFLKKKEILKFGRPGQGVLLTKK